MKNYKQFIFEKFKVKSFSNVKSYTDEVVRKVEDGKIYYTLGTINLDGSKDCVYHREDGPALIWTDTGERHWFVNGRNHRLDGPASIYSNNRVYFKINGVEYSKEEWEKEVLKILKEEPELILIL
jgi:hypothetical protein